MSSIRTWALVLGSVVAVSLGVPTAAARIEGESGRPLLEQIQDYRAETRRWERVMGQPPTQAGRPEVGSSGASLFRLRSIWKERAERARRRAHRPPHRDAWLCIHAHEGAWNDTGAPYYGGLQMDLSFQRTYGSRLLERKGTADNWTPLEQMWVAEAALRAGRGFHPWPNAARLCGLL
ncbi:MAG TPA: hypothetical protein VHF23_00525 [Gaiellaceae bacterium]|nr:hypothetical protein [Gaiellaceae bacterium]